MHTMLPLCLLSSLAVLPSKQNAMAWPYGKLQDMPHKADLAAVLKMPWGPRSHVVCAAWQAVMSMTGLLLIQSQS